MCLLLSESLLNSIRFGVHKFFIRCLKSCRIINDMQKRISFPLHRLLSILQRFFSPKVKAVFLNFDHLRRLLRFGKDFDQPRPNSWFENISLLYYYLPCIGYHEWPTVTAQIQTIYLKSSQTDICMYCCLVYKIVGYRNLLDSLF